MRGRRVAGQAGTLAARKLGRLGLYPCHALRVTVYVSRPLSPRTPLSTLAAHTLSLLTPSRCSHRRQAAPRLCLPPRPTPPSAPPPVVLPPSPADVVEVEAVRMTKRADGLTRSAAGRCHCHGCHSRHPQWRYSRWRRCADRRPCADFDCATVPSRPSCCSRHWWRRLLLMTAGWLMGCRPSHPPPGASRSACMHACM